MDEMKFKWDKDKAVYELLMKLALISALCYLAVLVCLQQNATMLVAYRYNDCSKTL